MAGNKLFKNRHPQRVEYEITGDEWDLFTAVTDGEPSLRRGVPSPAIGRWGGRLASDDQRAAC